MWSPVMVILNLCHSPTGIFTCQQFAAAGAVQDDVYRPLVIAYGVVDCRG
jgi:hypothetical protein